jgi:DNA-binding response OmpR family regulator
MNVIQIAPAQMRRYEDAHLGLDFEPRSVRLDARPIRLGRKEYDLLAVLVRHAGEVVKRETLLMLVWGYSPEIRTRTLDVHIRKLRSKLGRYSTQYIETIFGVGYRFQPYQEPRVFDNPVFEQAMAAGA